MRYRELLQKAQAHMVSHPHYVTHPVNAFSQGAHWMRQRLNELSDVQSSFNPNIPYTFYGLLKYALSLLVFFTSLVLLYRAHILLTPISIPVFYIAEVHFLFLFPLLIDGSKHPIRSSITATYKLGIIRVVATVLPVGLYMLFGLLNVRKPLHNWHTGCMAIIIWYHYEVRARL